MSFATGLKRTFINADYATINDLTATNLNVVENARVGIDLAVIRDTTIGNDLAVGHDASVGNDAIVENDLGVGNDVNVGNDVTVGNTVTATSFLQRAQPAPLTPYLLVPTGTVVQYVGGVAPGGWYLCDGSALSRSDYSQLYSVIGTTFGVGDGETTFNVPDFRGRVPLGAGSGAGLTPRTLGTGGGQEGITTVPPHTHTITDPGHTHTYLGIQTQPVTNLGGDSAAENDPRPTETTSTSGTGISVNSTGTNIAGGAVDTMNPFLIVAYIIKV